MWKRRVRSDLDLDYAASDRMVAGGSHGTHLGNSAGTLLHSIFRTAETVGTKPMAENVGANAAERIRSSRTSTGTERWELASYVSSHRERRRPSDIVPMSRQQEATSKHLSVVAPVCILRPFRCESLSFEVEVLCITTLRRYCNKRFI